MRVLLHDIEVDEATLARLDDADQPSDEVVRRAVALYDALDNPDEVLADHGLLAPDEDRKDCGEFHPLPCGLDEACPDTEGSADD